MKTDPPDLMMQAIMFRQAMNQPLASFERRNLTLQAQLISEEYIELLDAHVEALNYPNHDPSKELCLKELADLVFVIFQYAAAAGWELDVALDRVYESNMSKLVDGKPVKNKAGKVTKGPNYKPPYLADLV